MTDPKPNAETDADAPSDTSLVSGVSSCSKSSTPLLHSDEMRGIAERLRDEAELTAFQTKIVIGILSTPQTPWRDIRRETIEECAKWHDTCAAQHQESADRICERDDRHALINAETENDLAEWHMNCAAAIRALPTPPALIGDGDQK